MWSRIICERIHPHKFGLNATLLPFLINKFVVYKTYFRMEHVSFGQRITPCTKQIQIRIATAPRMCAPTTIVLSVFAPHVAAQ
jgi:hypothetical protein